jgi:hypothetical protein
VANNHNFRVKNGLEVGGVLIVNSSGELQGSSLSGAVTATSLQLGGDANPTLTGDGTYLKITTSNGYIDIGAGSSSWAHFTTDRGSFYFNRPISINGNLQPYTTSGLFNLGTTSYLWNHVYANGYFIGSNEVIDASRNLTNIGSITASGSHTFTANDVDFIVQDTTDSITNFIWRDHSANKLYLGTQNAIVDIRSPIQINSTQIFATSRNMSNLGTISSGNITTTGYLRGPSTFTIDPATHGDETGTLVIAGNLQVD